MAIVKYRSQGMRINRNLILVDSQGTKVAYRAKHIFFAPERYTAEIFNTDSLNSA